MGKSREKICVILGAGASFDVRGAGSPVITAGFQPPLARDLFNLEEHDEFRPILAEYPGAVVLAQGLASKSSFRDFDLEKELRRLAEHPEEQIRQHFKDIPPYLRDLLLMCSYRYTSYPSSYILLVQALLAEVPSDILFLVLNYDDLLEQAIYRYSNGELYFESLDDYVRSDRSLRLVKLHGCINWFKPIGPAHNDWKRLLREANVLTKPQDDEIQVVGSRGKPEQHRTYQIELGGQRGYPVLTAPLAGKGSAEMVCPANHLMEAREFLSECPRFLIIGSSGLDVDLLDLLKESATVQSPWAYFVNGTKATGVEVRERFASNIPNFRELSSIDGEVAFEGGFHSFVAGDSLVDFLRTN